MKIAVSIVSFNTRDLLRNCLRQVFRQVGDFSLDVWVIDNASLDFSAEMVEKEFSKVHLITSDKNSGFARGHNQILKQIKADYVLILNPDTKIPEDAITKMVDFMQKENCQIASCKIIGFDKKLHSNGGDLPFGMALFSWLFNLEGLGVKPNFHRQEGDYYQKAREVGWVGGTFLMVKQEVFSRTGFLNEDYFMYFEDVDFCFKAKKAGLKVMINPGVVVEHASGASSSDPRLFQWKSELWGLIHFYKKNTSALEAFLVKILVYKSIILRMIAFGLLGRLTVAKTYGKVLVSI